MIVPPAPSRELDVLSLADCIRSAHRASLARAITLVESRRPDDQAKARALVQALLPETGKAMRVGITGVPGVGKSTMIDALGSRLTAVGRSVAVLAIDPSSARAGGSILGDKTRMPRLAADPRAFIRPSPAGGMLGGVAARTREAMLLCEAAGFDVILIETVGTGQSETAVADMTDFLLVLVLPGAGDELQGIKRGLVEIADMIAVNKADGENAAGAAAAAAEYRAALRIMQPSSPGRTTPVVLISGRQGKGLEEMWALLEEHWRRLKTTGELAAKRRSQQVKWLWMLVENELTARLRSDPRIKARLSALERAVADGTLSAMAAASDLVETFLRPTSSRPG